MGVELAAAWGVLAFALNYCHTSGAGGHSASALTPAFIGAGSAETALFVLLGLLTIQFVIGSYLEPSFSGSALAISPTVVIFAELLWTFSCGGRWGRSSAFPLAIATLTVCDHSRRRVGSPTVVGEFIERGDSGVSAWPQVRHLRQIGGRHVSPAPNIRKLAAGIGVVTRGGRSTEARLTCHKMPRCTQSTLHRQFPATQAAIPCSLRARIHWRGVHERVASHPLWLLGVSGRRDRRRLHCHRLVFAGRARRAPSSS